MKKLSLSLDDLAVETFRTTSGPAEAKGTVRGFETRLYENTCDFNECAGPGTYSDTASAPFWTFCVETCDGYNTCRPNHTCGGCAGDLSVLTDCHRCTTTV